MPTTNLIIAELARAQHGVVHRRQLHAAGVSDKQIRRRVQNDELVHLGHGVFAVPSARPTRFRQYKAAELAIEGATVAELAAAKPLGLGATGDAAAEIVVHPSSSHRCTFATVHRRRDVRTTTVRGIRVTDVPQTLVDITTRVRLPKLEEVWCGALIQARTTLDQLAERVEAAESQRLRSRGPARAMLDALVVGTDLADSQLEVLLHDVVSQVPGIPALERQMPLPFFPPGKGRADIGVPEIRTIVEADGRAWHARLRDFDADRMRDNRAVAAGWSVLRFTAVHLRRQHDDVIEIVAETVRHRRAA